MNLSDDEQPHQLDGLLEFLRDTRGFDFTGYKRTSLGRRIEKRMHEVGTESFGDYQDILETNADEFETLFNTILINVTGFFRDPGAWQFLQQSVLPAIVEALVPDEEIRVWSAGCSSGEEAYSLAIAFAELLGIDECLRRLKIYGTDVDEEALRHARSGIYAPKALQPLSDEQRAGYFEPSGANFAFRADLRRKVIFGRHDITRDAPISRLHLLACRNTLMYFNVETQNSVVDRLHFALRDGGYLFLGKAEMLLSDGQRFEPTNMRHRIFRRRPGGPAQLLQPALRLQSTSADLIESDLRTRELAALLTDSSPNALIGLDAEDTVVLVNTQARASFGLSNHELGHPFRDLELSYSPTELRSLIERAKAERRTLRVDGVEHRRLGGDDSRYFDVLIRPLIVGGERLVGSALIFIDSTRVTHLEDELRRTRENLETAYAELQSTNEELETTNEELQSSNEELETTNEEMRIRSAELDEARAFSEGVLGSIDAVVMVLDRNHAVRGWNHSAEDLWGLRDNEARGRPFFSLEFGLPTEPLRPVVEHCLATREPQPPIEIHAVNRLGQGVVCSIVCSPLQTPDGDGGVVLFVEAVRRERPGKATSGATP